MDSCKISVIVPVYNAIRYLGECVESILNQTFPHFELILVDDGSTDASGELCDQYASSNERIKVIHKVNGGSNSARNAGLKEARGTYICYVDCDDLLEKEALFKLYQYAEENNLDIAVADLVCFEKTPEGKQSSRCQKMPEGILDKAEMERVFYPQMLFREEFCFGAMPTLCSKLFRRELLSKNQFQVDEKIWMGEDGAITYPCYLDAERIGYLKGEGLYLYRMLPDSLTHKKVKAYFGDRILILCHYLDRRFAEKTTLYPVLKEQILLYMLYLVDSMFLPHGNLSVVYGNRNFFAEINRIKEDALGKEMVDYCQNVPTSSRAKRLLKVLIKPSFLNRLEYYLFLKYEKVSGFLAGLKQ